ncbi:hypothetical protein ACTXT7_008892 [Hymenolepis weldensis]
MFESSSVEIKILSAKIEDKYSRDIYFTSTATTSHTFTKNCPPSPMVLSTETPVEAANDNVKLHPSVRDCVKVTNLMHSKESSMPTIVPARFVFEPTVPKSHTLFTKTKSLICLGQFNYIRAKPKLVFHSNRSALVDNKCKEHEEIVLAKSVSYSIETLSKVVAQNAQRLTKRPHSFPPRISLCALKLNIILSSVLLDLFQESLILVDSYSKWSEVIPIKAVTTDIVINSPHQVFANHGKPKMFVPRNVTQLSSTPLENLCHCHKDRRQRKRLIHVGVQTWVR